ncbi:phosphotriesterase [soil metagenome]
MTTVETVTGPVEAGELGFTLIHEHLRCQDEAVAAQWPDRVTLSEDEPFAVQAGGEHDEAVKAAERATERGVKTIADPTAMFLGRDVEFMRKVSEQTGLQVVPCTGIYTYDHLPQFFQHRSPEQIAEMFVGDIERGIQGTEIKAAFIKCAADLPGVTENVEKIHRASAMASVQTGAPIMAHSAPAAETGPKQVDVFEQEGVDLSRVQIAHCGDSDDPGYIEGLIDRGVFVGLDRFGLELFLPFEKRIEVALALLEKGHAERIFLAADSCATLDWYPPEAVPVLQEAGQVVDWDIRIVPDKVIPALRDAGITDDQLETMTVGNAVSWLTAS